MAAMRRSLEAPGEGEWTAWNAALERKLLRTERYLGGEEAGAAAGAGGAKADGGGQGQLPLAPPGERK
jgi:hypothetical protein